MRNFGDGIKCPVNQVTLIHGRGFEMKALRAWCVVTPSFQMRGLLSYHLKLLLPTLRKITGVPLY